MCRKLARILISGFALLPPAVIASAANEAALPVLIAGLKDHDWQVRRAAARQLGEAARRDGQIVSALRTALDDLDSRVRRSAATALGQIGSGAAGATPQLIKRLRDVDPEVVRSAAQALGLIGRRASRADRGLKPLLDDSDAEMRLTAADALGRIGRDSAASSAALVALLGNPEAQMRSAAASALGRAGEDAAETSAGLMKLLGDDDAQVRTAAAEALGKIGNSAVPQLIASLNGGNPVYLQATVEALAQIGEPAVPALIEALEDGRRPLLARQHLARALGRIGNGKGKVVPALLRRLKDENALVRIATVEALGNLGSGAGAATSRLVELVDDRDEEILVREYAITAVARVAPASPEVKARLVEAVADSNARISEAAVAALVEMRALAGQPGGLSALMNQLQAGDAEQRLEAALGLADLGPYARPAVNALAFILQDEANASGLRIAAARALGMIGPAAEPALPALNGALRSANSELNDAALIAMQRIGPQTRAIPALMEALRNSDLGVRGSAAVAIRNFALARLQWWQPLLAQSDAPVLRSWVTRHNELYGVDEKSVERSGRGHEQVTTDYFDVLGGRAGVRESVQLQSLKTSVAANDARTIPIEDVQRIDVESHPFSKMLKESGTAPGRLPLADFAPLDHFFAYFRDPAALSQFMDGSGDMFLRLESAFSLKSLDYSLKSRYLARMGMTEEMLAQLEGLGLVGEIGFVAPDLFFIDGTEITTLIRIQAPSLIGTVMRLAGLGEPGATGIGVKTVSPGMEISWARRDDLLIVSTSAAELKNVLDLHDNPKKDSLGRSDEFGYMLQRLPIADTTRAYFYFSDPSIRELVGPQMKIAQLRRMRVRADLDTLTAGALLYKLDGNTAAPTKSALIDLGYVPRQFSERDYSIATDLVAKSEQFGSSAALKPLGSNPVELVSKAEAAAYAEYLKNYSEYWRQFFDPIAVRMDELDPDTWELTTFILPLLDSDLYNQLRDALTTADSGLRLEVPQLTPTPVMVASMNLSDSMRLKLAKGLTEILKKFTSVDPAIFDAFTPTVHIAVQDSTPIVAVGSGDILGVFSEKMLHMEGFEPFLPILISLASQPSSVFIELAEPEVVLKFLRDAMSGRSNSGESQFHQVKGEDAWIYSVSVFDMVQLHLRVAVENDYLVISNLPWSPKAAQTGTVTESLNGARL
ncbi:MAG: HEAT repeat domain-containing protein, partial [Gammaproteobacteria bacterium]|nr:HEAT repeat domain-containing protein [Gammaproteobacteria bacterium]